MIKNYRRMKIGLKFCLTKEVYSRCIIYGTKLRIIFVNWNRLVSKNKKQKPIKQVYWHIENTLFLAQKIL